MKSKLVSTLLLILSLFVSTGDAFAARRIVTVHGILGITAKGERILITSGNTGYYFDPASAAGSKILSVCQTGKDCVVRGVINGNRILNAYYVKVGQ